jgi:NADH-quinone oxidoreductase subunit A
MGILVYILFATFLAILIVSLSYFLVTQSPETEKLSTYECGFEPYEDSRNKFSVDFIL